MQNTIRIDNPTSLDAADIEANLSAGKAVVVQFIRIPSHALLAEINHLCAKHDQCLTVRFYSSLETFNCAILSRIPQVKSLALDCMERIENIQALTTLRHLQCLSFEVYGLQEIDILQAENLSHLSELSLGATKSKALNLVHLSQMKSLKRLFIEGHTKHIETIGELNQLRYLCLHGISKVPLCFVNQLKQLKTLHLSLGGRENLDEIDENTIESLSLGRVRGLQEFNNLANFKALKSLLISEQIQLKNLSLAGDFSHLMAILLQNCKTLNALIGLSALPNLQHLSVGQTQLDFDALWALGLPASLKNFSFHSPSRKESARIASLLSSQGYQEATWFNLPAEIHDLT